MTQDPNLTLDADIVVRNEFGTIVRHDSLPTDAVIAINEQIYEEDTDEGEVAGGGQKFKWAK